MKLHKSEELLKSFFEEEAGQRSKNNSNIIFLLENAEFSFKNIAAIILITTSLFSAIYLTSKTKPTGLAGSIETSSKSGILAKQASNIYNILLTSEFGG